MLSGVVERAKKSILSLGPAGQSVKKDFDDMTKHIASAMKNIAVASYAINKLKPGVAAAADLQESMVDVHMNLMRAGQQAGVLSGKLAEVRRTALDLQKITPFSAVDVVHVENEMLKVLEYKDVVGKGAAHAAMTLATITKQSPETATSTILGISIPYHLKGSQDGEVADVIQKHVMSGRMTLPQLNESLADVATTAKSFKVPWHDMITGLAVMGENSLFGTRAGTHLKDFYSRMTGTSRISRRAMKSVNDNLNGQGKASLNFWDAKEELLPTEDIIKSLRSTLGSFTTKKKMFYLHRIFGDIGGNAALALMAEGPGSWEFVKGKVLEVAGAEEKITERLKSYNAALTAVKGTATTTLAVLFDPMLAPLTRVNNGMNTLLDNIRKVADAHPGVAKGVDLALAGSAAVAIGLAIRNGAIGVGAGFGVLRGLAGGKAIEAATGVTPVFVTNMTSQIPIVGGMIPAMVLLAPALLATLVAGIAIAIGKSKTDSEVKSSSTKELLRLRAEKMVLTGGEDTYQVEAIDKELKKRNISIPDSWGGGRYGMQLQHSPHNIINLSVQFDPDGKITARSNDLNTTLNAKNFGSFFDNNLQHPVYP